MREMFHRPAPDSTVRILRESVVVVGAISRHQREAASQSRASEVREMEALRSGIARMVFVTARPQ